MTRGEGQNSSLQHQGVGLGTQADTSEFTHRLLARAKALGLNKAELARRAGLSRQTLDSLLGGSGRRDRSMASIRTYLLLGQALRVHPSWLIEGLFSQVVVDARFDVRMRVGRSVEVEDLNYPQGAAVAPATRLIKRWRVTNRGQRPWIGLRLVCQDIQVRPVAKASGEPLFAMDGLKPEVAELEVPEVPPGASQEIELAFTAPATSGTVVSKWVALATRAAAADDVPVFGLWFIVHVTTLADTIGFAPFNDAPSPLRKPPSDALPGTDSTFASKVMCRAGQLQMTKKGLAQRAALSRQTLDNLLGLGQSSRAPMPSIATLVGLAVALKIHPYWLVEGLMADARRALRLPAQVEGDRVGFVEEMSAPDGSVIEPGAHFYKAQTAHKFGDVPWRGRKLVCWDEKVHMRAANFFGANVPIQRLKPDRTEVPVGDFDGDAVFSVAIGFTAPQEPGWAASYWVLAFADGTPCFNESIGIWALVYVEPDAQKRALWPQALNSVELPLGALPGCVA